MTRRRIIGCAATACECGVQIAARAVTASVLAMSAMFLVSLVEAAPLEVETIFRPAEWSDVQLSPDGELLPGTVEILCEVLRRPYPFRQQAAAWSLGYLGPAARRAVTRLLATLDAAPKTERELRERTVFALVAIVRGTPDEDRVIAHLAEARKSAEGPDKTLLTRALLRLVPKAEQLVPELRGQRDDTPGPIEIGRLPRSFREAGSPSREL
jgi:hypothetical protein